MRSSKSSGSAVPRPERVAVAEQVADLAAHQAADLLDVRQRGRAVAVRRCPASIAPRFGHWAVK